MAELSLLHGEKANSKPCNTGGGTESCSFQVPGLQKRRKATQGKRKIERRKGKGEEEPHPSLNYHPPT